MIVDAAELLDALVTAAEQSPELAERLRLLLLLTPPVAAEPQAIYCRVAEYAARVGVSRRTGWNYVRQGLPTIGEGRNRRVDVARGDAWLRARGQSDDGLEQRARRDAARAARKATG